MTTMYDAIVIGAGHNGLVAAALLAQAGVKVLILERRAALGGAAATEEIFPGFKFDTGAVDAGLFRPEIVKALNLTRYGLALVQSSVAAFAPQPDGSGLTLWRDVHKSAAEIRKFSPVDADRLPGFTHLVGRMAEVLKAMILLAPPDLGDRNAEQLLPWLGAALKLKGMGDDDMMEFLRALPMTVTEFLDEWFTSDALKGVLGTAGIIGSMNGPRGAGSTLMMLYHYLGEPSGPFRSSRHVLGGMARLSAALAAAARQRGTELRVRAPVAHIRIEDGRAIGVMLENGEEIAGRMIVSSVDPRRTLLGLVGGPELEPEFVRLVRNIRYQGVTAKVNLALSGLPHFTAAYGDSWLSGHIVVSPSLDYLEHAYDDAKYGRFSQRPYLDVVIPSMIDPSLAPPRQHVMSITMQYAPYALSEGNWNSQREALGDQIVATLAEYAPNLNDLILHRQVLTPQDWECEYGLTRGDIFHGQMGLDQLLFMRPVAGYAQYRTPIANLYLCGAGTHPGGGVTGAPGYNAARAVVKELKRHPFDV